MKNKPHPLDNTCIDSIIRVDHAGEYGAKRIYEGQLKFIRKEHKELIHSMYKTELVHLEYFNHIIKTSNIRPTILLPLWHKFAYLLGIFTSFNKETALICTEAVESVIEAHYKDQIDALDRISKLDKDKTEDLLALKDKITKFREEEIEHQNLAINLSSSTKKFLLYRTIQFICKAAISLSKRI